MPGAALTLCSLSCKPPAEHFSAAGANDDATASGRARAVVARCATPLLGIPWRRRWLVRDRSTQRTAPPRRRLRSRQAQRPAAATKQPNATATKTLIVITRIDFLRAP